MPSDNESDGRSLESVFGDDLEELVYSLPDREKGRVFLHRTVALIDEWKSGERQFESRPAGLLRKLDSVEKSLESIATRLQEDPELCSYLQILDREGQKNLRFVESDGGEVDLAEGFKTLASNAGLERQNPFAQLRGRPKDQSLEIFTLELVEEYVRLFGRPPPVRRDTNFHFAFHKILQAAGFLSTDCEDKSHERRLKAAIDSLNLPR